MPAPLQIKLTAEEERTLSELRVAQTVPQRTRDRAHMLRLNAQGWTVPAIAEIFNCHEHTVRSKARTLANTRTRWALGSTRARCKAPMAGSGYAAFGEMSGEGATHLQQPSTVGPP